MGKIMRSTINTGGGDWLGIKEAGLVSVRDESERFDWADVYLVLEFQVKGSKYTRPCKITGSFEHAADGTIEDGPLLKRITYMCDALGWNGGIDKDGKWLTEDEKAIDDIGMFLTTNFGNDSPKEDYVIYVYKEKGKNGKTYTRVHNRFMTNEATNKRELQQYVNYLKEKGYIKEVAEDDTVSNNGEATPTEVEGVDHIDIANL